MKTNASRHGKTERRVLTVIRWPVGGIRTYLFYNYPTLAEAGYRFTLVGPADDTFRSLCKEASGWEGVEFVEAPVVGQKCRLRSAVRRVLGQRRHALIHSQGLTAGVQAVLANVGCGLPHIITSHDVIRADQFPGFVGAAKRRLLGHLLGHADALVAVSHDARANHLEYLPSLARRADRVQTIINGIDTSRFDSDAVPLGPEWRAGLGIPADAFLMGFMGRFMEQKGFLVLLDALQQALAESPARRLHLLAVGSGDYLREYQAEIAQRTGLSQCISFVEHTPNVAPILRAIDLLVIPSLWEACPLLPMEALCAGTPVLGSDCIGLREVLAGTPTPMTPARDASALARAIRRAVDSPWTEESLRYAPQARRRFDVRASAQQLRELFGQFVT